jgi:predicted dehydrogenase
MTSVLLAGSGPMAVEHAKVLQALGVGMTVVGRGPDSAAAFTRATGIAVHEGGLDAWLMRDPALPAHAVVAVGERWLGAATLALLERGVKNILVEKPGGATPDEIGEVDRAARRHGATVFVAYNRRFYASVLKAEEIVREDGGATSFHFEFTEWSHVIKDLVKEPGVKEHWFLHNSTHVIDLAFHLGGKPRELSCYRGGRLAWHPAGSVFAGAGVSDHGALFSYQANWEAPGRWGVEVLTRKHRLIFRPLEKLQAQKIGSVAVEPVAIDDTLDTQYKAGLFRQEEAFLAGDARRLCTIEEQASMEEVYRRMLAGASGHSPATP